jgi:hypothetical protein
MRSIVITLAGALVIIGMGLAVSAATPGSTARSKARQ